MVRIQSILAATDFSSDARYAAERAAMISAEIGVSQGVILHVIKSSWLDALKHFVSLSVELEQSMVMDTSRSLYELIASVQEKTGFVFEPRVDVGNILDSVSPKTLDLYKKQPVAVYLRNEDF